MNRVWETINDRLKQVSEPASDTASEGARVDPTPRPDSVAPPSDTTARPGTDVARLKGPRQ